MPALESILGLSSFVVVLVLVCMSLKFVNTGRYFSQLNLSTINEQTRLKFLLGLVSNCLELMSDVLMSLQ